MEHLLFGNTGLHVSRLGFGAMHLNDGRTSEDHAGYLLNAVLDTGVNFIDTARGYGLSEERIGRHLSHRRDDFVLSTKIGYGIDGIPDWTAECITAGVDAACARMRRERLDIVHLHSCPLSILERGEVVSALEDCVRAGKVRVMAYSGENAELEWAIRSGRFGAVQTSISLCDQRSIGLLPEFRNRNIGVIAKRPLAGAIWRHSQRPNDFCEGQYWDRLKTMSLDQHGLSWNELALRFTAFQPGVATSIVGTSSFHHFSEHLANLEKGPLDANIQQHIRGRFDHSWPGLI